MSADVVTSPAFRAGAPKSLFQAHGMKCVVIRAFNRRPSELLGQPDKSHTDTLVWLVIAIFVVLIG
jgi:hypothetical protein